jgi:hypothetical protein
MSIIENLKVFISFVFFFNSIQYLIKLIIVENVTFQQLTSANSTFWNIEVNNIIASIHKKKRAEEEIALLKV